MAEINIANTETDWGLYLFKLAEEAAADAAQRDSSTVLAEILNDLSNVLRSYAGRCGVERLSQAPEVDAESEAPDLSVSEKALLERMERLVDPPVSGGGDGTSWSDELLRRIEALEAAPSSEPQPFDLPGWVRDTLQSHHERLTALELAFASLQDRIAFLESNANLQDVIIADPFLPDPEIDQDDYRPEAWGSIEQARKHLSNRVKREYSKRARIRQTVLNAVTDLATRERTQDDDAELNQQRQRVEKLDQIDPILGVKLDEIAALDDLEAARVYDTEEGWPT